MNNNAKIAGSLVMFAVLGLFQPAAEAAVKAGDRFEDWAVECHTFDKDKTLCVLSQTITAAKTNQRIAKLSFRQNDPAVDPVFTAIVPLGIILPAGVAMVLSTGQAQPVAVPLTVETCTPQGCIATTRVNAALLKVMQTADGFGIRFVPQPKAKPVTIKGSLKGFAAGYKALKPTGPQTAVKA